MPSRTAHAFSYLLERGVTIAPFQHRGRLVLLMVDHRGQIRRQVVLRPGGDLLRAMAVLEAELERIDPRRPRLQLVKPESNPPAARLDPGHRPWEDQLAYHLRIARRRAQQLRRFR